MFAFRLNIKVNTTNLLSKLKFSCWLFTKLIEVLLTISRTYLLQSKIYLVDIKKRTLYQLTQPKIWIQEFSSGF